MRPDLDKCTTECYRRGAGSLEHTYKIKFGGKVKFDPDPEHEYDNERGGFHSSARHRHKEYKDFGDKLGALRGNLRANLGRRWDDVFSEFCQSLDRRSVSGHHIWTHLMQEVSINTYVGRDGKVYEQTKYGSTWAADKFYVHPITGILEYKDPGSWKRNIRRRPQDLNKINLVDGWFGKIDGLWFRFVNKGMKEQYMWEYGTYLNLPYIIKKSANRKEISWIKERILQMNTKAA